MGRTNSLEKTLLLGMIEGKKEIGVAEDEMVRVQTVKDSEYSKPPTY